MQLANGSDPSVLSSITFSGLEDRQIQIQTESLTSAISEFHSLNKRLVIKIDIEGAEWKLLRDHETIETFQEHKPIVLLAIHPGFHRPFRKLPFGLTLISKSIWHARNSIECYQIFKSIATKGQILRTNFDTVRSPKRVVALMLGGCHEFILDFR